MIEHLRLEEVTTRINQHLPLTAEPLEHVDKAGLAGRFSALSAVVIRSRLLLTWPILFGCMRANYMPLKLSKLLIAKVLSFGIAAACMVQPDGARAQDLEYFNGKTIQYLVGSKPGGGYDRYARLIAPYLEKHLPGSQVVVINRPSGGGIVALNKMSRDGGDGQTIMTLNTGLLMSQMAGMDGINFDLSKFGWLGKAGAESRILVLRAGLGIHSFSDLLNHDSELTFVSSSFAGTSHIQMNMLIKAFELNARLIAGFGGNEAEAALIKGEIDGILVSESNVPAIVEANSGVPIIRFGPAQDEQFSATATGLSVSETDIQKLISSRISTLTVLGRLTAAAPGTPEPALLALQSAYAKALQDPALLAEAKQRRMPIAFLPGEDTARLVEEFLNPSGPFVSLIQKAIERN